MLNSLKVEGRSPNRGRKSARQDSQVVMQDNKYTEVPFALVGRKCSTVVVRDAKMFECVVVMIPSSPDPLPCCSPASEHTVRVARGDNSFGLRSYNLRESSNGSKSTPIDPFSRLSYDEEKADQQARPSHRSW